MAPLAVSAKTFSTDGTPFCATTGTPGLMMPAFSPAMASTVFPRYCM